MDNFLNNCKVTYVLAPVADGQAATATSIVDMAGWDGVAFIALTGDVTSGCVLTLTAQQDELNGAGGMASLTGTATYTALSATDADNKALILDVQKPNKQFVRALFTSATQNAVKAGVIAIQYRGTSLPAVQGATVIKSKLIYDAAE